MSNATTMQTLNRRRYERFRLQPMYTTVAVCPVDRPDEISEGHAYEISEGGLRFELDEALPLGSAIVIRLTLPAVRGEPASDRTIFAQGTVLRILEEDAPGPVRMAARFTRFIRSADRDRLLAYFATGHLARAA